MKDLDLSSRLREGSRIAPIGGVKRNARQRLARADRRLGPDGYGRRSPARLSSPRHHPGVTSAGRNIDQTGGTSIRRTEHRSDGRNVTSTRTPTRTLRTPESWKRAGPVGDSRCDRPSLASPEKSEVDEAAGLPFNEWLKRIWRGLRSVSRAPIAAVPCAPLTVSEPVRVTIAEISPRASIKPLGPAEALVKRP